MLAYRTITTISRDGVIQLETLPFPAGSVVEIIVLANEAGENSPAYHILRDSVIKYDSPFEPVAQEDWEAMR